MTKTGNSTGKGGGMWGAVLYEKKNHHTHTLKLHFIIRLLSLFLVGLSK